MRGLAIAFLMLLAGCTAPPEPFPDALTTPAPAAEASGREEALAAGTPAPKLALGRAWTFEGKEFYNEDTRFTVVVAEVRPDGYLFAGGAEDDLVYEALWWSRFYGPRDLSLNPTRYERPILQFPLADGASWKLSDALTVTARAAPVDTPLGKDDGFVIAGANEHVTFHAEYSPRAQSLVLLRVVQADGTVRDDVRMTAVADAQPWIWYELGPLAVASSPHEPALLDVTDGFDHVLVSAGGTTAGRARVEGPGGASWSAEFDGAETWKHAMLPAAPGRWAGLVAGRPFVDGAPELPAEAPVGWAYMHVAPVRWTRSSS